jgi:chemotaxis regulatin CheY-phosphate phosphatase CheZ
MSQSDNGKRKKHKTRGTAHLLEQSRTLTNVIDEHGEKRAMFAFALSLSENSDLDYQPDDAKKVHNAINTMMHEDLQLESIAEFLKQSQESLNQTLFNLDDENNKFLENHLANDYKDD